MYICVCRGVTHDMVDDAVSGGARTSGEVAAACGAGADCGRCRRTVQAIIAATSADTEARSAHVVATLVTSRVRHRQAAVRT
jgi:bacterioferritin-associated ferredoxin